ncbi:unnamed protein product, partial [Didymodactylos carnosus]
MDKILKQYNWKLALVYVDDLIVSSVTFEEHLDYCDKILKLLIDANITMSLKKCHLFQQHVQALGHIISNLGLSTCEGKAKAVANWKTPKNQKQIQQFLGLATYYRRFIKYFATIAKPLTRLLAKDKPFIWTDVEQASFEALRTALITAPVLAQPNFSQPFRLYTDASNVGIGAILGQVQ